MAPYVIQDVKEYRFQWDNRVALDMAILMVAQNLEPSIAYLP
jgi:hypothetical protein